MDETFQVPAAETDALREAYAALNRNDIDGFMKLFDPEVVRVEPPGFPSSGTYRGLETVKDQFSQARATWAEGTCEPERFTVIGEKVVVSALVHVRLKDRKDWIDGRVTDVFTFRDGKIIDYRSFVEERDALAWAGAPDPSAD